jgi:predicted dinucleotide-binding enzyme
MNIGIVGSGNMGRTIGLNWANNGHNVFFGHRRKEVLEQIKELAGTTPIMTGSNQDAVINSDIILYCIRDTMPSEVLEKSYWNNKVVIDLNNWANPVNFNYEPIVKSIAESYQEDIPNAYLVKALNNHAQETFELSFDEIRQTNAGSFFCGDNETANKTVATLINETGLTPIESGKLNQARILESMANLIRLLMKERGIFISYALTNLPQPNNQKFGGRNTSNLK